MGNCAVGRLTLAASASSGLSVSFSVISGPATVSGNTLTITGAGTVVVAANQSGNSTYGPAQATQKLTVNQAQLTVTANNASMTYGGIVPTLSGTVTGVVAGDGITASYFTQASSTSTAGNYPIVATLNDPNGKLGNYAVINTSGTLTIGKATPAVSWATSASIPYGTALGSSQLNATSTVAGSFSYSPSAGTVLTAGSHNISVNFTPTDATDYQQGSTEAKRLALNRVAGIFEAPKDKS